MPGTRALFDPYQVNPTAPSTSRSPFALRRIPEPVGPSERSPLTMPISPPGRDKIAVLNKNLAFDVVLLGIFRDLSSISPHTFIGYMRVRFISPVGAGAVELGSENSVQSGEKHAVSQTTLLVPVRGQFPAVSRCPLLLEKSVCPFHHSPLTTLF